MGTVPDGYSVAETETAMALILGRGFRWQQHGTKSGKTADGETITQKAYALAVGAGVAEAGDEVLAITADRGRGVTYSTHLLVEIVGTQHYQTDDGEPKVRNLWKTEAVKDTTKTVKLQQAYLAAVLAAEQG